jgi:hypothetical protein
MAAFLKNKRGSGMYLAPQFKMRRARWHKTLNKEKHFLHSSPRVQKGGRKLIQHHRSEEKKLDE